MINKKAGLLVGALLVGCGGGSGGGSSIDLERYTLNPYTAANASVSNASITGTWVVVWSIINRAKGLDGAKVERETTHISRKEFVVVRSGDDGLEIATCANGFNLLNLEDNYWTTSGGSVLVIDKNNTRLSEGAVSAEYYADLVDDGRATFSTEYRATYYKISDATGPLGGITWNWSDQEGTESDNIYCAGVNRIEGGAQRLSLGTESGTLLSIGDSIEVGIPDARFQDRTGTGYKAIELMLGVGDSSFSVYDETDFGFSFNDVSIEGGDKSITLYGGVSAE